jgi:hypothetical protein
MIIALLELLQRKNLSIKRRKNPFFGKRLQSRPQGHGGKNNVNERHGISF